MTSAKRYRYHPSHKTRFSDASSFDTICDVCGANDSGTGRSLYDECWHLDTIWEMQDQQVDIIRDLQKLFYGVSKKAGWHDKPREDGTMLALIHSEISEALEGVRKDKMDDHLPHRMSAEVELADAIIRILDFAQKKGYDVAGALQEKNHYNQVREDHKLENRAKSGGKAF